MMIFVKILGAMAGISLVFLGFFLVFAGLRKKEIIGSLLSICGFMLFCVSVLLLFVPDFFG